MESFWWKPQVWRKRTSESTEGSEIVQYCPSDLVHRRLSGPFVDPIRRRLRDPFVDPIRGSRHFGRNSAPYFLRFAQGTKMYVSMEFREMALSMDVEEEEHVPNMAIVKSFHGMGA